MSSVTCAFCRTAITPDLRSASVQHRGRWLCPRCNPQLEIPGYHVLGKLGEGAMGVVYAARDEASGDEVAIKVIKSRGEISDSARKRFRREAQALASLDHPHILRVFGAGRTGDSMYIVMAHASHGDLLSLSERGPLPLRWAAEKLARVAEGLAHAHAREVVHRDVKPENVLFEANWRPVLADFGLVRFTSGVGSALTAPGQGLGTIAYMPPEQLTNSLDADARSDVYSLGASFFEVITGRLPFLAKTTLQFYQLIRDTPPPLASTWGFGIPRGADELVLATMAKDPKLRPDASDLATRLQALADAEVDPDPPPPTMAVERVAHAARQRGFLTTPQIQDLRAQAMHGGSPFAQRLRESAQLTPEQLSELDLVYRRAREEPGSSADQETRIT